MVKAEKTVIMVRDTIGADCITNEQGQQIHSLVYLILKEGNIAVLDFKDVNGFTAVFFNASIGQLLRHFSKESLDRLLILENLSDIGQLVVSTVFNNASECHNNPEHQEAVDRVNESLLVQNDSLKDGTDLLCESLYGEVNARHYVGGSDAPMLHDAVVEILKLRNEKESMLSLISWLAEVATESYGVALKMCSNNPFAQSEEVRQTFMTKFPVIQGTQNQRRIQQLGKIPRNDKNLLNVVIDILKDQDIEA